MHVQGACTEAPVLRDFNLKPEAPLLPLERGQCLLVTQSGLLKSASGPLWLDNLYIRRELPAPEAEVAAAAVDAELSPLVVTDKPEGLLWATGVVFQGDGAGGAAAVEILSAAYFDRAAPCMHALRWTRGASPADHPHCAACVSPSSFQRPRALHHIHAADLCCSSRPRRRACVATGTCFWELR